LGLSGDDRRILTKLVQKYEHVGDNHDSTYALGLQARKAAQGSVSHVNVGVGFSGSL